MRSRPMESAIAKISSAKKRPSPLTADLRVDSNANLTDVFGPTGLVMHERGLADDVILIDREHGRRGVINDVLKPAIDDAFVGDVPGQVEQVVA